MRHIGAYLLGAAGVPEGLVAPRIPIGHLLVRSGLVDHDQLIRALAYQQSCGGRLGDALVALQVVSEPEVLSELARQQGVSYIRIGRQCVPPAIVRLVPQKYIRSRRVFPIALGPAERRGTLFVATGEPQNLGLMDEVAFMTGMTVRPVLVGDRDLDEAIERHLGRPQGTLPASDPVVVCTAIGSPRSSLSRTSPRALPRSCWAKP